jgi:anti-sigma B factor antagonist
MTEAPLRVDARRVGDACVVAAHGEIDLATCRAAQAALDGCREAAALVLDLRGVEYMDTSGLRLVFAERERAADGNYRFAVVPGPRRVQRLFEIAGLPPDDRMFVNDPAELAGGDGR